MQRKWRRAWLRGKPHYMRHKPVRKERTNSVKGKIFNFTAKAAKKLIPAAAAAGIFLSTLTGVQANPTGGNITAGTGSITGQGTNNVVINQAGDKLAINWNSFNIASGEKVQFIQPGASSIALNRVLGNSASAIYGQLSANGKVFLINPNGVLFAKGAQVNVGGLVASTLNLSDKDFMNGKYTFSGDSQAGVLNQGNITAANGGYVALLGANAVNEGIILAKEGTVAMGAGSKVSLDFAGDGLLNLAIDESKLNAEVKNSGLIKADGGLVVMNAKAADALTGSVVNNTGTIEARSVMHKNGAIILTGDSAISSGTLDASGTGAGEAGGTVKVLGDTVKLATGAVVDVSGEQGGGKALVGGAYKGGKSEYSATKTIVEQGAKINADALTSGNGGQVVVWANDATTFSGAISAKGGKTSGDGGSVETSGKKTLTVTDKASVNTRAANGKTGTWLLDPGDYTVGTGASGANYMNNLMLSAVLRDANMIIESGTDNVFISAPVSWSGDTKLSLSAFHNIYINSSITNTGGGSLALLYGQGHTVAGNLYTYSINAPINLTDGQHFSTKQGHDGVVKQFTVITGLGSAGSTTGADLQGINGNLSGHYFLGADIDASATATWNSDLGFAPIGPEYDTPFTGTFEGGGHTVSNLFINRPAAYATGLFGVLNGASISNLSLVNATVTGRDRTGILAGYAVSSQISNSFAAGSSTGNAFIGGLVGGQNGGSISDSYSTATVSAFGTVGGLVGYSDGGGSITNSYATGTVAGNSYVGGLAGNKSGGSISNSYATGNVTGTGEEIGGLVGYSTGNISNSHATGSVTGTGSSAKLGGLVGGQNGGGISGSYATGSVKGSSQVGGLVGLHANGSIAGSYATGLTVNDIAPDDAGGLVGVSYNNNIFNSYWDADTTKQNQGVASSTDAEMVGKYTALRSKSGPTAFLKPSYIGLDFDNIWYMVEGSTRPFLRSEYSTTITNAHQLQLMALNPAANYTLANNIDMSELTRESGLWRTSTNAAGGNYGFISIGADWATRFSGTLDGNGHTVNGLVINSDKARVGLFANSSGKISNLGLTNVNITGNGTNASVGGLAGYLGGSGSSITNSYVTGEVKGNVGGSRHVGGLVGYSDGTINNSYSTASVTGSTDGSDVNNSTGGLVGRVSTGSINNSYATGNVSGNRYVGGLAGYVGGTGSENGSINGSYATGSVTGNKHVGGLVGILSSHTGSVNNSYATGSVAGSGSSNQNIGGLVGYLTKGGINTSYATGRVTGNSKLGGLVGYKDAGIVNSSNWDADTTGQSSAYGSSVDNAGGVHSTAAGATAFSKNSYNGFDFNNTWGLIEGISYPYLLWRYPVAPQIVSGTLSGTNIVGQTVAMAANGSNIGNIKTGANGFYYFLLDNKTIADNSYLLTYVDNGSFKANAVTQSKGENDSLTGVALNIDTVNVYGSSTDTLDVNTLVTSAKGSLADNDIIYTVTDGNVSVNGGLKVQAPAAGITVGKGLTAAKDILLQGNGNLTIGATGSVASTGGNVELVSSNGHFINNAGNSAVTAGTGKNWRIYSASSSGDTTGGLVNDFSQYGTAYGGAIDSRASGKDGFIYAEALNISANLTGTVNKTYDGNIAASIGAGNISLDTGGLTGVTATYTGSGGINGSYNSKNVADANTVTIQPGDDIVAKLEIAQHSTVTDAGGKAVYGYTMDLANTTVNGTISKKILNLSATVDNKTYDGTKNATVAGYGLSGFVGTETVSATSTTANFSDRNAATGKTVTIEGIGLSDGTNAGLASNYTVAATTTATANIDKKALALAATAANKTYDGTKAATVTGYGLTGFVDGETVTASTTGATFSDKNAGNGKTVNIEGISLSDGTNGGLASNYTVATTTTATADIDKKALALAATAANKTYDGTKAATVTGYGLTGFVDGETVTASTTGATFSDKNAGNGKTVNIEGISLSDGTNGGLAANYTVANSATATANIDKAALTITATTNTKTYDGTTTAVTTPEYTGLQTGDTLTNLVATYDNKNTGSGKRLTVTGYTLNDGNGGNNYNITTQTATGTIDKASLNVKANDDAKIYDKVAYTGGNGVTYTGLVAGETESILDGTLVYGGTSQGAAEVGTYAINLGGLTSGNYNISFTDGTLTIKPAAITDPAYIAAVQNAQQRPGSGSGTPVTGATRTITTNGQTLTVSGNSPVQLLLNTVQKDIVVYQVTSGSTTAVTSYAVDSSHGALSLRDAAQPSAPQAPPLPGTNQTDVTTFKLVDAQGRTVIFTISYSSGSLTIQAANEAATAMLTTNQQKLITAAGIVAAQDKLGVDVENLQSVQLVK